MSQSQNPAHTFNALYKNLKTGAPDGQAQDDVLHAICNAAADMGLKTNVLYRGRGIKSPAPKGHDQNRLNVYVQQEAGTKNLWRVKNFTIG